MLRNRLPTAAWRARINRRRPRPLSQDLPQTLIQRFQAYRGPTQRRPKLRLSSTGLFLLSRRHARPTIPVRRHIPVAPILPVLPAHLNATIPLLREARPRPAAALPDRRLLLPPHLPQEPTTQTVRVPPTLPAHLPTPAIAVLPTAHLPAAPILAAVHHPEVLTLAAVLPPEVPIPVEVPLPEVLIPAAVLPPEAPILAAAALLPEALILAEALPTVPVAVPPRAAVARTVEAEDKLTK